MAAVLRYRSIAASAMRRAFEVRIFTVILNWITIYPKDEEFLEVQTPIITGNNCEGGSDVFSVTAPVCYF